MVKIHEIADILIVEPQIHVVFPKTNFEKLNYNGNFIKVKCVQGKLSLPLKQVKFLKGHSVNI